MSDQEQKAHDLFGSSVAAELLLPLLQGVRLIADVLHDVPDAIARPAVLAFLGALRDEVRTCKGAEDLPRLKAKIDECLSQIRRQLGN